MTHSEHASLHAWRKRLKTIDLGPYVGPKPQTETDLGMLIGRERDLRGITRSVLDRRLVVLHGGSGSGKSSLLQNGLFERLREAGFAVFVSRQWGSIPRLQQMSEEDANKATSHYVAKGIRLTHLDGPAPVALPPDFDFDELRDHDDVGQLLGDRFAGSAVVILDQFEELLRQNDKLSTVRLVAWVSSLVRSHDVKVVLSLRSDSLHLLDPLLRGFKPFTLDRLQLMELQSEEAIAQIIRTTRSDWAGQAVDDDAVERLLGLWREVKPPLLELQATLYALHFRDGIQLGAREPMTLSDPALWAGRVRITLDRLDEFLRAADSSGRDPFSFGLQESIRIKIDHAHIAAAQIGCDSYLLAGVREIARRVAPLLSSAGHKVPIEEDSFIRRALARELAVLGEGLAAETTAEPEADRPRVVTAAIEGARREVKRSGIAISSHWSQDYATDHATLCDVAAGPMMGASASATLREEVRRVYFGIKWLTETDIVRQDRDGTLTLIHDGAGSALITWAGTQVEGPGYPLRQLTGSRGEHFVWRNDVIGRPGDDPGFQVIANINWRDCRVTTKFRHAVFLNCDFSGTRFEACTFEGVSFVNCLLDDANFEHCSIIGRVDTVPIRRGRVLGTAATKLAPSFIANASEGDVADHCAYLQATGEPCAQFFSDTAGAPARPGPPPRHHAGETIGRFLMDGAGVRGPTCHDIGEVDALDGDRVVDDRRAGAPDAGPDHGSRPGKGPLWEPGGEPFELAPPAGGLAMFGGRLCFLTIYRCGAGHEGSIAFHHVSGDGLDIVEHGSGSIHIHDGAIRGVSMSRDDASEQPVSDAMDDDGVELLINDSLVTSLYFGDGLRGVASIAGSVVVMLLNTNDSASGSFRATLDDCRYQFLVNTAEPLRSSELSTLPRGDGRYFERIDGSESRFRLCDRRAFAIGMEAMDYRYRPEMWEARQRRRRLGLAPQSASPENAAASTPTSRLALASRLYSDNKTEELLRLVEETWPAGNDPIPEGMAEACRFAWIRLQDDGRHIDRELWYARALSASVLTADRRVVAGLLLKNFFTVLDLGRSAPDAGVGAFAKGRQILEELRRLVPPSDPAWQRLFGRLYHEKRAVSLLLEAANGGAPLPDSSAALQGALAEYTRALDMTTGSREVLKVRGGLALTRYLIAGPGACESCLDETRQVESAAAEAGYKDVQGWAAINAEVMLRKSTSGWTPYEVL
jgi:hypothetical protein